MRYLSYEIVIVKEPEDPGYYAYSPTLPGAFSNGLTVEEAREGMRESIELQLEGMRELGLPIPGVERGATEDRRVEDLCVAVPE